MTVKVPRTLDASSRFLFWDVDYVMVAGVGTAVGVIIDGLTMGVITGGVFCWMWAKARAGGGIARAFAELYWHLPFDVFSRIPASARRHFIG